MSDYADTADRTVPLSVAMDRVRKAFEKGKRIGAAEERGEISTLLDRHAALNGHGGRVRDAIRKTIHDAAGHDHGEADGRFTGKESGESGAKREPHHYTRAEYEESARRTDDPFHVADARYATGKVAVRAESNGEYKSDAQRLAEAVGGKWSNREKAYIMSPKQAERMKLLYAAGATASVMDSRVETPGERHAAYVGMVLRQGDRVSDHVLADYPTMTLPPGYRVEKAAAFVESEHPRDHAGLFIPKGDVDHAAREAAKGNHGPANELRAKVRPEDAAVLEEHLASPGRADPTEATGKVRSQRGIGEEHGHHVGDWLKAVTAAIRHGADYDHGEIQRATERAVSGQVPKLRRVLRVLDPDTLVSHQPASKEGLQRRIRDIISTAVHAARDIRQHAVRVEKEEREREMERHAAAHALTLHDSRERLHRFESWHRAAPGDAQALSAVAAAREEVARQLGIEKAFKESGEAVLKAKDAAGHEHRGAGPGGGQFTEGSGGGGAKKQPTKPAATDKKPAGKPKHKVADSKALAAVRAAALAKFQAAPKPTPQEARENVKGMRLLGADRFEANARGNSKDRRASRYKLIEEFGDGKTCPCVYCGLQLVGDPEHGANTVERDKIYTAAQGGKYRHGNLVPSCRGCNLARSDKPFEEFFHASRDGKDAGKS